MPRVLGLLVLVVVALLTACERGPAVRAGSRSGPGGASGSGARIVALSPALTQIARDLGMADRLVGRHAFDAWADAALPVCGDQSGLDYERLLATRPTHVLTQWGQREPPGRLMELGAERGWVVRDFRLLKLDDIAQAAEAVFAIGHPGEDFGQTAVAGRLRAAFAPRAGIDAERVGRVLLLYGGSPPAALGPGSWHHQLLERLGARPALTEGGPYQTLDTEDLAALAPDAIVLIAPRDAGKPAGRDPRTREETRALLGRLAEAGLPALAPLERGAPPRVALLDDPLGAVPGTNMAGLADALAERLRAWSAGGAVGGAGARARGEVAAPAGR